MQRAFSEKQEETGKNTWEEFTVTLTNATLFHIHLNPAEIKSNDFKWY